MKLIDLLTTEEKDSCRIGNFKKDSILFHEDEECKYVCLVIKGEIEIVSYTIFGSEIIFNTVKEDGFFGHNLLFSSDPHYRGNVVAKSDSEILLINRENFTKILQNNLIFLKNYLKIQSNFTKELNAKIKLLGIDSAEERILFYIREKTPLKLKSVSALSRELGLARETTSRKLNELIKKQKVVRKGNVLYLGK